MRTKKKLASKSEMDVVVVGSSKSKITAGKSLTFAPSCHERELSGSDPQKARNVSKRTEKNAGKRRSGKNKEGAVNANANQYTDQQDEWEIRKR